MTRTGRFDIDAARDIQDEIEVLLAVLDGKCMDADTAGGEVIAEPCSAESDRRLWCPSCSLAKRALQ